MLESLKDLYIAYPFLPVAVQPAFYNQIKDVRLVLELPATDLLLGYKNKRNGNYIRVWLTGFADGNAQLRIQCSQVSDELFEESVPLYDWELEAPPSGSFMLCDKELIDNPPELADPCELNPEVLVLLQKAPRLSLCGQQMQPTIEVEDGHNVVASITNNMITLYGAPGVGKLGNWAVNEPFAIDPDKQAEGARTINGLYGAVTVDGTFPVRVELQTGNLGVWVEDVE